MRESECDESTRELESQDHGRYIGPPCVKGRCVVGLLAFLVLLIANQVHTRHASLARGRAPPVRGLLRRARVDRLVPASEIEFSQVCTSRASLYRPRFVLAFPRLLRPLTPELPVLVP